MDSDVHSPWQSKHTPSPATRECPWAAVDSSTGKGTYTALGVGAASQGASFVEASAARGQKAVEQVVAMPSGAWEETIVLEQRVVEAGSMQKREPSVDYHSQRTKGGG